MFQKYFLNVFRKSEYNCLPVLFVSAAQRESAVNARTSLPSRPPPWVLYFQSFFLAWDLDAAEMEVAGQPGCVYSVGTEY